MGKEEEIHLHHCEKTRYVLSAYSRDSPFLLERGNIIKVDLTLKISSEEFHEATGVFFVFVISIKYEIYLTVLSCEYRRLYNLFLNILILTTKFSPINPNNVLFLYRKR